MNKILVVIIFILKFALFNTLSAQTSTYKIANKFSVAGEGGWDYLASDDVTSRLFISHGMVTQVIDSKSGKLLGTIADTKGVHGIAITNDLNKAFISCGRDSSVVIINLKTLEVIDKIKVTGVNPDAIIYDKFSHNVFAFNARSANATVIDAATNKIISTISLDGKPEFAVSNEKGKVFVNIEDKNQITVINTATLQVENSWSVSPGVEPSGLAIDIKNNLLFTVCDNKKMVIVNSENGNVVSVIEIGDNVDGCTFDPILQRAYSSNGDGTITVIQEENANKFSVLENISSQKGARTICIDKTTHHIFLPAAEYGETPPATAENKRPRAPIKPNSFVILDVYPLK